jgi:hypothetical protein
VLRDAHHRRPDDAQADVVPRHAAVLGLVELVRLPVLDILEVHDAVVVKVLAGPDLGGDAFGVGVGERVLAHVPAAEAEVEAADEGDLVVDDEELLVVRPEEGRVGAVQERVVVRVAHDDDVAVAAGAVRTQALERLLGVRAVARQRVRDLLVDCDVDLDAELGLALEDAVEPPLLAVGRRPAQEQLRRQPPVGDVDALGGTLERDADGPEVVAAVDVPFDVVAVGLGRERAVAVRVRGLRAPPVDGSSWWWFQLKMLPSLP